MKDKEQMETRVMAGFMADCDRDLSYRLSPLGTCICIDYETAMAPPTIRGCIQSFFQYPGRVWITALSTPSHACPIQFQEGTSELPASWPKRSVMGV